MFDKIKQGKFISKNNSKKENPLLSNEFLKNTPSKSCTNVYDTKRSIRASFQFIKDNPVVQDGTLAYAHLTLKVFLTGDVTSNKNDFKYALTDVDGVVDEVCESYVVLISENSKKEKFKVFVVYEDIVYFWHISILENFQSYVNFINLIPPICKDLNSESYNLLVKLAQILGQNNSNERDFVFILDKAITRQFKSTEIAIVRNLIVTDELFVNPITSIQGFSQIPNPLKASETVG